jgi:hypothetical protein
MHTAFFNRLFSKALQEQYKDQTETTILATDRYTYKTDEGGSHEQALCLAITPTHII